MGVGEGQVQLLKALKVTEGVSQSILGLVGSHRRGLEGEQSTVERHLQRMMEMQK